MERVARSLRELAWGVAVMRLRCKPSIWRATAVSGAICAALAVAPPDPAQAGFFDFFFNGLQQTTPPPGVTSYAEPGAPPRLEGERSGGRGVVYCVRLCDGQHFPMDHAAAATPVETCRAMCPASKTKVFFGSAIDHAAARDGQRYTDLDNAYVYRDHLVAGCTCNGKDAFGLAPFDAKTDPTLRPGDIVSTKEGLVAYVGKRGGQVAEFTPVDPATLSAQATKSAHARLTRRSAEPTVVGADDEPGTIVQQLPAAAQADLRGQSGR